MDKGPCTRLVDYLRLTSTLVPSVVVARAISDFDLVLAELQALRESVETKDDLIKQLNSRIKQLNSQLDFAYW